MARLEDFMRQKIEVAQDKTMEAVSISAPVVDIENEHVDLTSDAFMNEKVKIIVFSGGKEGDLDEIKLEVLPETVYIKRDQPTVVKRKFVEALVNARTVTFGQHEWNPHSPKSLHLIPRVATSYPFQLIEDHNPKGPAWLKALTGR